MTSMHAPDGSETVTTILWAVWFMIMLIPSLLSGHIDISMLGAMQVSQYGDLANWMIPVYVCYTAIVLLYSDVIFIQRVN